MTAERITHLLRRLPAAAPPDTARLLDELITAVYDELRGLARAQLQRLDPAGSVPTTLLVNEAYLKIFGRGTPAFDDRRHFYGAAARAMRNFLIDGIRARDRRKDGGWASITNVDVEGGHTLPPEELLTLDDALTELERVDPQQYEIVLLRYFAGLSIDEVAELLDISASSVDRQWRFARAVLHRRLAADPPLE